MTRLCRWGGNSISVERVVEASDEERRIGGEGKIWGLEIIGKQRVVHSQGTKEMKEGSTFKKRRTRRITKSMSIVNST